MNDSVKKFSELVFAAAYAGTVQNVVFHTPKGKSSEILKVKGTLKNIASRKVLQLESHLTEGRVTHENIKLDEVELTVSKLTESFRRADLVTYSGSATLMISKKGDKASLVTHGKLLKCPKIRRPVSFPITTERKTAFCREKKNSFLSWVSQIKTAESATRCRRNSDRSTAFANT